MRMAEPSAKLVADPEASWLELFNPIKKFTNDWLLIDSALLPQSNVKEVAPTTQFPAYSVLTAQPFRYR